MTGQVTGPVVLQPPLSQTVFFKSQHVLEPSDQQAGEHALLQGEVRGHGGSERRRGHHELSLEIVDHMPIALVGSRCPSYVRGPPTEPQVGASHGVDSQQAF